MASKAALVPESQLGRTMEDPLTKLSLLLAQHRETLVNLASTLGQPTSTVDTRISELHVILTDAVAAQRTDAEAEVQRVRNEVEHARQEILSMRAALGDDIVEPDIGEEPLLTALDRLRDIHDEVQNAYAGRVADFKRLHRRLRVLKDLLGPDFWSAECEGLPTESALPSDFRAGTLAVVSTEVARGEDELRRRQDILQCDLEEVLALWQELGTTMPPAPEHFDALIVRHLTPSDPEELQPTIENMERVQTLHFHLEEEKRRREDTIQRIYDELFNLWNKFEVPTAEQDAFLERWKGIEQKCVNAYVAERERMIVIKAENMALFVRREREDIERLRDEVYLSQNERDTWNCLHEGLSGDALLEACEEERQRLEAQLKLQAPILLVLNRYFALLKEIQELVESAKDQTRYKTRGDPGRLLREEKQRKRHAKERPKLEAEVRSSILQWEDVHGQPFLINGTRYIHELEAQTGPRTATVAPCSKTPSTQSGHTMAAGTRSALSTGRTNGATNYAKTLVKRSAAATAMKTPCVSKRPRRDLSTDTMKVPHTSVLRSTTDHSGPGSIPHLTYTAAQRPIACEWKPRPSITSLSAFSSAQRLPEYLKRQLS